MAVNTFLARIGLGRPVLRAWAMYDWANSAFWTTVIVAVFPPFFSEYAAAGLEPGEATRRLAWGTTIAVTIVALMAPVLGAIADHRPLKKRLLAVFLAIGVIATLLMATVGRGQWLYALLLFGIGNIGVAATLVFYDSLLPHVARPDELDRVSTAGFAIGFIGGGVLLLINLAWILRPTMFGLPDALAASSSHWRVWLSGGWSSRFRCSVACPNRRFTSTTSATASPPSSVAASPRRGRPCRNCAAAGTRF